MVRAIRDHYSFSRNSQHWWCGQRSAFYAPEYMFTASIYREITKLKNPQYRVDVEDPVEGAICDTGGWGSGRIPAAVLREGKSRKDQKFDIVLSDDRTDTPFAIIEVMICSAPSEVRDDAERIRKVLDRPTPTIRWGMLALVLTGQNENGDVGLLHPDESRRVMREGRIAHMKNTVRDYVRVVNCSVEVIDVGNDHEYAAMVFRIGPTDPA